MQGIGGRLLDGTPDPNPINHWDAGVADLTGTLHVVNTLMQDPTGTDGTAGSDPLFKDPFDVSVNILASRTFPAFKQALIVTEILPPTLMGDYHLGTGSPAIGLGTANTQVVWDTRSAPFKYTVSAPNRDIDGDKRPTTITTGTTTTKRYDAGSDQIPT